MCHGNVTNNNSKFHFKAFPLIRPNEGLVPKKDQFEIIVINSNSWPMVKKLNTKM